MQKMQTTRLSGEREEVDGHDRHADELVYGRADEQPDVRPNVQTDGRSRNSKQPELCKGALLPEWVYDVLPDRAALKDAAASKARFGFAMLRPFRSAICVVPVQVRLGNMTVHVPVLGRLGNMTVPLSSLPTWSSAGNIAEKEELRDPRGRNALGPSTWTTTKIQLFPYK